MLRFPQAKINIGLNVIGRRSDGYHNLETVFYAIPFCDALEIIESKEMRIDFGGCDNLCDPQTNLVWKAYDLLRQQHKCSLPPVEIILRKQIPSGAGLGGGSSDASMTLLMLREMFDLPFDDEELKQLSGQLGADCPFFINPTPHYAEGIGDRLTPIDLDLSGKHLYLILPGIHISTKEAYAEVSPRSSSHDLRKWLQSPIGEWRDYVKNDFEEGVFARHPVLGEIKESLYLQGAEYASMSGSGSTMYALSKSPLDISKLSEKYITKHFIL
ncbi:4-(cytidine 5'-diphospho)-2-C-methyl-D-erythritol kinase [Porphyromonas sp.]|uniref:4-(cytidine 5'-diphospho)-2-C-methyl-D-erythritol kinase n=1 Tax=Porphyromonas sp. TaxID=1924944 RepID=UPI0026DD27EA|nr:4-(cytidine 5'-diphospho)-2-C-methyl-D-erythritol kinase [Porphyromonas sp.]MDO4695722.1 4-(cytidine 5'-diphospho)-2-C-methyl-D-erythritol kinase [Porphyromonas sp.]MDO4771752.1 4-(cytidine 5'-diphospho)-2-C-methyl-D-erythritol kinase [Porphyromonas sp.]